MKSLRRLGKEDVIAEPAKTEAEATDVKVHTQDLERRPLEM